MNWRNDFFAHALAQEFESPRARGFYRPVARPLVPDRRRFRVAAMAQTQAESTKTETKKGKDAERQIVVPFIRAAHEHTEGAFADNSDALVGNQIQRGPFDVPAYGYATALWILATASGGVLGAGALDADYPFNVFDELALVDVNGQTIYGPLSGYDTFVSNLIGGYAWSSDPTLHSAYAGTINFNFAFRIPIIITGWDGYGALPNENAASAFKFRYTLAASTTTFDTAVTTNPTVRVRAYLEALSHPPGADAFGNAQATAPPGVGSTQFWSHFVKTMSNGRNTVQFIRVGNLLRNMVFIARTDAAGTPRADTPFPDPYDLLWDNRQVRASETQRYNRAVFFERSGINLPTGVFVVDFTHDQDGKLGNESRHLWYPTVQATRLELVGSNTAAGTLKVITNDVAPVGGR